MKLIKTLYSLRKKNIDEGIFLLRTERNFNKAIVGPVSIAFVLFGIVDYIAIGENVISFFIIRSIASVLSIFLFHVTRGRLDYSVRAFLAFTPFSIALQYIMISYNLTITPYFLGVALIMFPLTIIFPMRFHVALIGFLVELLPSILFISYHLSNNSFLVALLMAIGAAFLLSLNANEIYNISKKQIKAYLSLQNHLKTRNEVISQKVEEISKRKKFEAQYSPQVARAILSDKSLYSRMEKQELVVMVFDIKNSTKKTVELPSEDYKYVVEDIFDIINTVCLKWDVTVDKFTGDGVQVFAGSPVKYENDFQRCINVALEVQKIVLQKQQEYRLKWKERVGLRIGISSGRAFVGFIGKGFLKSFTALGPVVSFTHRICAESPVDGLILYAPDLELIKSRLPNVNAEIEEALVSNLKGLENQKYKLLKLVPHWSDEGIDNAKFGICDTCGMNLVLVEDSFGIPKIICEKCDQKNNVKKVA